MKPLRALVIAGPSARLPEQGRLDGLESCGWAVRTASASAAPSPTSGTLSTLLENAAPHLIHAIDPGPRLLVAIRLRYGGPAVVQFDRQPTARERLAASALRFDQISGREADLSGGPGLLEIYLLTLNRAFAPPEIRPPRLRVSVPARP